MFTAFLAAIVVAVALTAAVGVVLNTVIKVAAYLTK